MNNALRLIRTGDEAGACEPYSVAVDRVLSEISRLYFERAKALSLGDRDAFRVVDVKITFLKNQLTQL